MHNFFISHSLNVCKQNENKNFQFSKQAEDLELENAGAQFKEPSSKKALRRDTTASKTNNNNNNRATRFQGVFNNNPS